MLHNNAATSNTTLYPKLPDAPVFDLTCACVELHAFSTQGHFLVRNEERSKHILHATASGDSLRCAVQLGNPQAQCDICRSLDSNGESSHRCAWRGLR